MELPAKMAGRRVTGWQCKSGQVIRWDPLSAALCDALVLLDNGLECWFSSDNLKPIDNDGPLPSRREARRTADETALQQLKEIREDFIRDFNKPWPGMEFGKYHIGIGLNKAIEEIEIRLGYCKEVKPEIITQVKPIRQKTEPDIDLDLFS